MDARGDEKVHKGLGSAKALRPLNCFHVACVYTGVPCRGWRGQRVGGLGMCASGGCHVKGLSTVYLTSLVGHMHAQCALVRIGKC